jgi:hypothetical protein
MGCDGWRCCCASMCSAFSVSEGAPWVSVDMTKGHGSASTTAMGRESRRTSREGSVGSVFGGCCMIRQWKCCVIGDRFSVRRSDGCGVQVMWVAKKPGAT